MSDTGRHIGFAQALDAGAETRYVQEIAPLSSLSPEEAQAEARKIMRGLAYSFWHQAYGSHQARERFDALWLMAVPEEEKGSKK